MRSHNTRDALLSAERCRAARRSSVFSCGYAESARHYHRAANAGDGAANEGDGALAASAAGGDSAVGGGDGATDGR